MLLYNLFVIILYILLVVAVVIVELFVCFDCRFCINKELIVIMIRIVRSNVSNNINTNRLILVKYMSSSPPVPLSPESSTESSPESISSSSSPEIKTKLQSFVDNRRKYQDYLHDLRIGWQKDFAHRANLDAARKEAEKREIVTQKAIRLREKRADAVIRQEKAKKLREQVIYYNN